MHRALAAYDGIRRPSTQAVQRLSDELGRIYMWAEDFQAAGDGAAEKETAKRIVTLSSWVGVGDLEEEVAKAEAIFALA